MKSQYTNLKNRIRGEVKTDSLWRYMLSTDGSIFRVQPDCVVYPKDESDVILTVKFANTHGIPIHARGAGSGLCGSAIGTGIVLDFTRYMNRLSTLDADGQVFECEPGYRFGELATVLKGKGLFFPPDPSSGEYATFGGMVGTNASGAHSVKYGNTGDYLVDARIILGNGDLIQLSAVADTSPENLGPDLKTLCKLYEANREKIESAYPQVRYNSSGYNLRGLTTDGRLDLRRLFAGSEGTLGIATRLKFRLLKKPDHDSLVVAFFESIGSAAEAVLRILPMNPSGIEIMDKSLLNLARENDPILREKIPEGIDNVLLVEFDGATPHQCTASAGKVKDLLKTEGLSGQSHIAVTAEEKGKFWAVRKAAVPILYRLKGPKKILALIEDAAVPTDRLVEYFNGLYRILTERDVAFVLYGHIAKGLIHTRPLLDLKQSQDVALLRILADEVFELVHFLGGTVSGEHGDGRLRTAYIRRQYPDIYPLFDRVKALLDKNHILNPEIKTAVDSDQMKKKLRFGAGYRVRKPSRTHLHWPEGFLSEIEKCHGCSKCTTVTTATRMCPVFKFTRNEAATPRSKANVLRALISGDIEEKKLYEAGFQDVVLNCVNCGSCSRECPSHVNIPKMAMEARAFYIDRFGASTESQFTTRVELAGKVLRKVAPIFKKVAQRRPARQVAEHLTGLSARREMVLPAFRSLFERVGPVEGRGDVRVLFFAGCYAGYVRPEIGRAAVSVLKQMGMTVFTPPQHCCGLPMLSKGMTVPAAGKVGQNLHKWGGMLDRVDYVTVTCSSCGFSLMKEWNDLVGERKSGMVRDKVVHVTRLISRYMDRLEPRSFPGRIAYHMPCHLKLQPRAESSLTLLSQMPEISVVNLDSHCCGMAGSWGMSAANVDLSIRIGSELMGKLDESCATAGVTDCPTCRIQMEQMGTLPVLHPVEMVARCLHHERS